MFKGDYKLRDYMQLMKEMNDHRILTLAYDPKNFSIDFIREFKDKVNWVFNCGPYDEKILKEFGIEDD